MTRTVKWLSVILNAGKWVRLIAVVVAYSRQKDAFLREFAKTSYWGEFDHPSQFRDREKKTRVNFWRLPTHLYDRALFDAMDTMKRWILASIAQAHIRSKIFRVKTLNGRQRHYAFWILKEFGRIGAVLRGETPVPKFAIPEVERRATTRYLRRLLRQSLGRSPRAHLRRSFELDSSLYRFFMHEGTPYLAVTGMMPRERIVIPLKGFALRAVTGNVRVVLHPLTRQVAVHIPLPVRVRVLPQCAQPVVVGLDAGVTEVFTRDDGKAFGEGFGRVLDRLTEQTLTQGAERNRLHARAKRLMTSAHAHDRRKAGRILRFNLGVRKLETHTHKGEADVRRRISQAVRAVLADHPEVVVAEDLTHMRGRTKSRKLSRKVSRWMRQSLRERLDFLSGAGGSRLEIVNAAYSSQECPACGYVNRGNRTGDLFRCLKCGFAAHADRVGAINTMHRHTDPELRERIHLGTPKEMVKAILLEIHQRSQTTPSPNPM